MGQDFSFGKRRRFRGTGAYSVNSGLLVMVLVEDNFGAMGAEIIFIIVFKVVWLVVVLVAIVIGWREEHRCTAIAHHSRGIESWSIQ